MAWPNLKRNEFQRSDGQPLEYAMSSELGRAVQLVLRQQPWARRYMVMPEVREVSQAASVAAEAATAESSGIGNSGSNGSSNSSVSSMVSLGGSCTGSLHNSSTSSSSSDASNSTASSAQPKNRRRRSSDCSYGRKRLVWLMVPTRGSCPPLGLELMICATPAEVSDHIQRSREYAATHQCVVYAVNFSILPPSPSAAAGSSSSGSSASQHPEDVVIENPTRFRDFALADSDQVVGVNVLLDTCNKRAVIQYPATGDVEAVELAYQSQTLSFDPRRLAALHSVLPGEPAP